MVKDGQGEFWNEDNSGFIVDEWLPKLELSDADCQVIKWAYGHGEEKSYELESDGESGVHDTFLNGQMKDPAGVTHDYINRVVRDGVKHKTPDGKVWTCQESNNLYYRIKEAKGDAWRLRRRRWAGLAVSGFLGRWIPGAKKIPIIKRLAWWN